MKMNSIPTEKFRSRNSFGFTNECRGEGVDEEDIEGGYANGGLDQNLERGKPVKLRATIQKHLHRSDSDAEAPKPEPVHPGRRRDFRFLHEERDAREGKRADRHVDIEYPSPAVVVGQPAADHRSQHRSHHDRHAEQRHRRAALLRGVDIK
jgi:hypothetical protein